MMKKIKFSKNYPKLWNQRYAMLLKVIVIDYGMVSSDLKEYDTKADDDSYYELPMGKLLHLTFLGDELIPFCTIRRFTKQKFDYYSSCVDQQFEIVTL